MPQIIATPLLRRHFAPFWSAAYFFRWLSLLVIIFVPFIISYAVKPFWLYESVYVEQPSVRFKHQMILMVEGATGGSELVWSTYDQLNSMVGQKYRVAEVQARQEDWNRDGKADSIFVSARVPLKSHEVVHHVRFIMFFQYMLQDRVKLEMESAAYFDSVSVVPGAECTVYGTLQLRQNEVLDASVETRTQYNQSIIIPNVGGIDSMEQVLFTTMLENYHRRNETTEYAQQYPIWTAGPVTDFTLNAHIRIPVDQTILYRPGILDNLRHGILMYYAVFIVFSALINYVVNFCFENQVFETRVRDDNSKMHTY